MQIGTMQQQTPQDYILAQIDQVYHQHRAHVQHQQQQVALRHRRRLVRARAAFQQELDRALSDQTQVGLGIRISFDGKSLSYPEFVASFEFQGQLWMLTCQRRLWGCDWFFKPANTLEITCCTRQTLEAQLCYALGQCRRQALQASQIPFKPLSLKRAEDKGEQLKQLLAGCELSS